MSDNNEKKQNKKKECQHVFDATVWLRSRNYEPTKYCRKCLELYNAAANKKPRQESR